MIELIISYSWEAITVLFHLLLLLLTISGVFCLLIGMMTVGSWGLPIKAPADKSNRINQSMSRRGNCWDNAPMEPILRKLFGF